MGDPAVSQVLAVAAEWSHALVRNEPAEVGRFMTEDWVYVGPTGSATKADTIQWIADGRLVHHTMEFVGKANARRIGDTVVVTARKRSTGAWEGTPYAADEWITEVYVQTGDGWLCAFSQKTDAATDSD